MKKSLSLLLVLVMLLACLTSCGGGGKTDTDATERQLLTLKCAVIVDEKTTAEGIAAMQAAFNEVCKQKYSTALEFVCFTADEYEAKIDAEMQRIEDEKARGSSATGSASNSQNSTTQQMEKDEYGMTVPTYPSVKATQFDLVLICNEDMYHRYIENNWIIALDEYLQNVYQRIMPTILSELSPYIKVSKQEGNKKTAAQIYGIPAHGAVGEYTYLALNKKVVDSLKINVANIKSVSDAYSILLNMESSGKTMEEWGAELIEDGETFSPIFNTAESFKYANAISISADGGYSILGATFEYNAIGKGGLNFTNLLNNANYCTYLEMMVHAKAEGYFGQEDADEFIVGLIDGEYAMSVSNPDYYYCPLNLPRVEEEDIFNGMLSVSSFTINKPRSVEIIQEFMTNSELLNILLYGDSENYSTTVDGLVSFRASSNYGLDQNHLVGNLQSYAKPCADFGQTADYYRYVEEHNKNLRNAFLEYDWPEWYKHINVEKMTLVDTLSRAYLEELLACDTVAAFRTVLARIQEEMVAEKSDDPTIKANAELLAYMMDNKGYYYDSIEEALAKYKKGEAYTGGTDSET
ncbi:MAG: hypothetical protein J6K61_03335 [Clostridia bacterium]|nr:hypothetical protein [Clostridia bacterium]